MKNSLNAPGTRRLKRRLNYNMINCSQFCFNVAFNFNLRRHSKGRYVPLAVIVPRLGAENLLALRPDLLGETLAAGAYTRSLFSST